MAGGGGDAGGAGGAPAPRKAPPPLSIFWHPVLPLLRAAWSGLAAPAALKAGCTPFSPATLHALLSARPPAGAAAAASEAPPPPPPQQQQLLLLLLLPRPAAAAALVSRFAAALAGLPREAADCLVPSWVLGAGPSTSPPPPPPPGTLSVLPLHSRLATALRRVALPRLLAAAAAGDDCGGGEAKDAAVAAALADADAGGVLVAVRLSMRADACAAAVFPRALRAASAADTAADTAAADAADGEEEAVRGWLLAALQGNAVLRDATDVLFGPLAAAAGPPAAW
jgi:hypothetical protein